MDQIVFTDIDINLTIVLTGMLLSFYGLLQVTLDAAVTRKTKMIGYALYSCLMLYDISFFIERLYTGHKGTVYRLIVAAANYGEFLFVVILLYAVSALIRKNISGGKDDTARVKILNVCVAVQIVLLTINLPFGFIYTVDENSRFQRGPAYILSYITLAVMVIVCFSYRFSNRHELDRKKLAAFDISLLLILIMTPVYLIVPEIHINLLGAVLIVTCLYVMLLEDQRGKYEAKLEENFKIKQRLISGQLEPHFLNNTLIMIRNLCEPGSDSYRAISNLAEFVGGSLKALKSDAPIPVEEELLLVERYLDIQNQRFGDSIEVLWDIQDEDFCLPAFSIQLAVENAIKHGIRQKPDGRGNIDISTYETDDAHIARIENDGVGFDPETVDSGTGLSSLRSRVELLSRGSVDISSAPDSNTVVTIKIPKQQRGSRIEDTDRR